jgi:hypothetical protein
MPPDLFGQRPRPDPARVAAIKGWVAQAFGLPDGAAVAVLELRCAEPGCPPLETVIALLDRPGQRQYKLPKGLAEVTFDDVARLTPPGG